MLKLKTKNYKYLEEKVFGNKDIWKYIKHMHHEHALHHYKYKVKQGLLDLKD